MAEVKQDEATQTLLFASLAHTSLCAGEYKWCNTFKGQCQFVSENIMCLKTQSRGALRVYCEHSGLCFELKWSVCYSDITTSISFIAWYNHHYHYIPRAGAGASIQTYWLKASLWKMLSDLVCTVEFLHRKLKVWAIEGWLSKKGLICLEVRLVNHSLKKHFPF